MEEFEFKRLIEKYQHGLLSGREKELLDKWFEHLAETSDPVNWSEQDKAGLRQRIAKDIEAGNLKSVLTADSPKKDSARRDLWRNVFRAAAFVALLVSFTYTMWRLTERSEPSAQTLQAIASQAVHKVILADGSIVWLKAGSRLTYPEAFSGKERHVSLSGEALFEVARNPTQPFIIQCDELTTTVLGTSFNIKSSEEEIEVIVLTGKVSLTSKSDVRGLIVMPNEKAVYNLSEKQIAKVDEPTEEKQELIGSVLAGTDYRMFFEDTRLEDVITKIEKKFDVKFQTENQNLANCMISANFTGQSLEQTLSMIAYALNIEYHLNGKTVVLRGAGCTPKN